MPRGRVAGVGVGGGVAAAGAAVLVWLCALQPSAPPGHWDLLNGSSTQLQQLVFDPAADVERPLLSLVMIVKNEASNIAALIDSVRPYVDTYSILDTGSTDDTVRIIRERFG